MRRGRGSWGSGRVSVAPVILFLLCLAGRFAGGWESGVVDTLDGGKCGESGECVSGYICDPAHGVCVRAGDAGPTVCLDGQTVCSGKCVVLANDEANCGG